MTSARFKRVIVPKVRFWYRHWTKPETAEDRLRAREGFWAWAQWWLGEGDWKEYGPRNKSFRPNVPRKIPARWWARLGEIVAARNG